jgi:hypothetical protein
MPVHDTDDHTHHQSTRSESGKELFESTCDSHGCLCQEVETSRLASCSRWKLTVIDRDTTFTVEGTDDLFAEGLDPLELASVWIDLHALLMTLPVGVTEHSVPTSTEIDGNMEPGAVARTALGAAIDLARNRHDAVSLQPDAPHFDSLAA